MLFIKRYDPERYPCPKLKEVHKALQLQAYLHEAGVACPRLYGLLRGYLLQTRSGIAFCFMDACEGTEIDPGSATSGQMYDLGRVTGQMHRILSRLPMKELNGLPSRSQLLDKWRAEWNKAQAEKAGEPVMEALEKQRKIMENLNTDFFHDCEKGWAHRDLWVDNILFQGEKVSAILDFDRMKFAFPGLDVARAVLSGAYASRTGLNMKAVSAFVQGYREYKKLTPGQLARSFRLLWCLESSKWLTADIAERSEHPQRFFAEMCWIAAHWMELEEMMKKI
ncbi:homoserine kinase type II [Lihuaxuella thermophila]|uniref:Homoserine kinase type II n=2 Tax=Lihuaxuella thermophila TaxID=1173111 RepID=A0A1H8FAS8_9BACL|nr:homoserine kinase type II [Lihuaxuella thermophila]